MPSKASIHTLCSFCSLSFVLRLDYTWIIDWCGQKGWVGGEEGKIWHHSWRFSRSSWRRALLSTLYKVFLWKHSQTKAQWEWHLCYSGCSSSHLALLIFISLTLSIFFFHWKIQKNLKVLVLQFHRLDLQGCLVTRRSSHQSITP